MSTDAKFTFTPLPARGLIHVEGEDRTDFLQGLVTADLATLPERKILYSCLLTAQGKFLHDFFLHHGDGFILIDCEGGERAQDLYKRLSLYRLRAKIRMSIEDHHPVYATSMGGLPDPRHPALGNRSFEKPDGTETYFDVWDENRIRLGVPDGSRDMAIERDTPLDCGLDRFNAIAFDKGCYVGQEVTARMNYRGLVKKHLYPVSWTGDPVPEPFTDIHLNGTLIGQARSHCGQVALLQLKDEALATLGNAPFTLISGTN